MDPQMTAIVAAILPMLEGVVALGIPGLLLGMAAIPAIVIALICWLNYRHDKQIARVLDAYRKDTQEILQSMSEKHEECIREFGARHQEVVNFYSNNVALVKNHEKMSDANQQIIINNTRAIEGLRVVVESLAKGRVA